MKRTFSTGQAAKICGISERTIKDWFDADRLPGGWRVPGSKFRRIPEESLVRFYKEGGMPLPRDLQHNDPFVMCVSGDPARFSGLSSDAFAVVHAVSGFAAGLAYADRPAQCVVIDFMTVREGLRFVARLKALSERAPAIIAVGSADVDYGACDKRLRDPFDVEMLRADVMHMLGLRA